MLLVTVSDGGAHITLKKTAEAFGHDLKILNVPNYSTHGFKLLYLREFARRHPDDTILFVDAFDTLILASPSEIELFAEEAFKSTDILISSEANEALGPHGKTFLESGYPDGKGRFPFLNSGVMLAKGKSFFKLLSMKSDEDILQEGRFDRGTDQGIMARWFLDYFEGKLLSPRLSIDHSCKMSLSHIKVHPRELRFGLDGASFEGIYPFVIHFNGRSYQNSEYEKVNCQFDRQHWKPTLIGELRSPTGDICDLRHHYCDKILENLDLIRRDAAITMLRSALLK